MRCDMKGHQMRVANGRQWKDPLTESSSTYFFCRRTQNLEEIGQKHVFGVQVRAPLLQ